MTDRSPIAPDQFETWEQLILSDQVDAAELAALLVNNPDFAAWMKARAVERQS